MAEGALRIAYPEWTEHRKKGGLDPLGMQTSSVNLYQSLLPGISNVTLRIRYYGLYTWLCRTYARKISDTDPARWQRIVRRAEALYALIGQRQGNEFGMAGVNWAARTLQAPGAGDIDFAVAADPGSAAPYLQQAWGAYGAAYASQLHVIGLFNEAKDHAIPVPGKELGEPLAEAFEAALGSGADRFFAAVQRGNVAVDELDEFVPIMPSLIAPDSVERACYQKVLFGPGGLDRDTDRIRARSLRLILHLTEKLGRPANSTEVRWALYTGCLPDGSAWTLGSDELAGHRLRWWIYQANDLTHIAYATLLKFSLDLLEPHPRGITLPALLEEAISRLQESTRDWPSSWTRFLARNRTDDAQREETLSTEAVQIARDDGRCTAQGAWNALQLLAVVHHRVRSSAGLIRDELGALDPGNALPKNQDSWL